MAVRRPDRRTSYSQLRSLAASQNILTQADGSAKFELGETCVLASVVGPVDVSIRDEKLDEATVEVVVRPASGVPGTKEKLVETTLRTSLESVILGGMMPRTLIQIVVQILKDDGSILAAAVNAITLALLDAGVPIKSLVAAMTCMIDKDSKQIVMDPTAEELERASSVHTFAFDNSSASSHPLLSDSAGDFDEEQYFACHEKCHQAVLGVHQFLRTAIESKKQKEYLQQQDA